jgi:hypothetical protein
MLLPMVGALASGAKEKKKNYVALLLGVLLEVADIGLGSNFLALLPLLNGFAYPKNSFKTSVIFSVSTKKPSCP